MVSTLMLLFLQTPLCNKKCVLWYATAYQGGQKNYFIIFDWLIPICFRLTSDNCEGSPSVRSTAIFCELFIGLTWQRVFYMAIRFPGADANANGCWHWFVGVDQLKVVWTPVQASRASDRCCVHVVVGSHLPTFVNQKMKLLCLHAMSALCGEGHM